MAVVITRVIAVDIAADDHHGADFRRGSTNADQHDGYQRKAQIPEQRHRGAEPGLAQRANCSWYSLHASSTDWRDSAATIGVISTAWATIIAVGVNSSPRAPSGPARDRSR